MKKNILKKYIEILKENNLLLEENISEELKEKEIEIVTYDSRDVKQNTLFICKGAKFKIDYLEKSLNSGAIAYVAEEQYKIENKPYIIVKYLRKILAIIE